jgi:transcriptional regulator with XRE-family HTH domain
MLNKFIKKQRLKKDFPQEHLASQLNISRPTYMQIENGNREITVSEAKKLASLFDIPLVDFLEEKDTKRKIVFEKEKQKEKNEIRINRKDLQKFKNVLLYILGEVGAKQNIGETVIHKLLYFIDFDYYEKYEENLMGARYMKNHHGPTSVELSEILKEMQKNDEIEAVNKNYYKYSQKRYLPKKEPDLSVLSAREIKHIDGVLARLSDKNAKEIENYSHQDIPWQIAKDGGEISYESVFYRDEKYSVRNYDDEI